MQPGGVVVSKIVSPGTPWEPSSGNVTGICCAQDVSSCLELKGRREQRLVLRTAESTMRCLLLSRKQIFVNFVETKVVVVGRDASPILSTSIFEGGAYKDRYTGRQKICNQFPNLSRLVED